jgi:hypothetical protein
VVVIGTEFPDLGSWLGVKFLDKTLSTPVAYIDLTAEFSRDLIAAPAAPNSAGAGTLAARAAHLAAPDAAVVLVRVNPAAFFQVFTVARFARGDTGYSEAMQSRLAELSLRSEELKRRNTAVAEEYRQAFLNQSNDERPRQRREQARLAFDRLIRDERELTAATGRAVALQNSLRALAGCTVLVNTLVWESGYALDGLSELSQLIDTSFASEALAGPRNRSATRPRPANRPLWVQAASPSAGSVWGGAYLDLNNDGAMEFATPGSPIPRGGWARDLNFLAARGADGGLSPGLAKDTKVRLTIQWRETHDPTAYGGQDSIFPLSLRVFRQLDPEGKVRASDELREVARSAGRPFQVVTEPTFGVYEQVVEFTVPDAGRYCVMVEGQLVFDPRLPALRRQVQVNPRLFAEFLGAGPDKGKLVFASFAPPTAGVGIPGDAKAAVTVGETATPLGTTTTGLTGGGPGLALLPKPDLLADGTVGLGADPGGGSGVAAGFAGGVLAALVGSGAPAPEILRATGLPRGGPAVIPENWLRVVPPRQDRGRK